MNIKCFRLRLMSLYGNYGMCKKDQDRKLKPKMRKKKGGRRREKHFSRRAEKGEKNCHIFAVMGERDRFLIGVAMAMVGT